MCESNKELKSEIVFMFFATFLSKVLALTMDGIKDNLNHVHCCCCWIDDSPIFLALHLMP